MGPHKAITLEMINDPDVYFRDGCGRCNKFATDDCKARKWGEGLRGLREICLDMALEEGAKWGQPVYMLNGKNVVMFAAFKDDFNLTFFKSSLLKDPEGILTKRGENTQSRNMISFKDVEDVALKEQIIRAYLTEAIANEKAGKVVEKKTPKLDVPDELVTAMDDNPALAEAFIALTPGRQRSWCIYIRQAKRSETRKKRVAAAAPKVLEGKGFFD